MTTQRRNAPRPAPQMRATGKDDALTAAATKAGAAWRELCQNEPIAAELFVPKELREALVELAKATAA